ncbi:redoxin domain-containing protein [Parafilimonas sp.]|uniref:redoxin domain-containing protein n=1 Tax=Parafilimonas sp. TaxID=1969739 RepID=UPI0039E40484
MSGEVKGEDTGTIYLKYWDAGIKNVEAARIQNGQFQFNGFISEPVLASLTDNRQTSDGRQNIYEDFYLDSGNMMIYLPAGNFKEAKLTGSKTNEDWLFLSGETKPFFEKLDELKKLSGEDSIEKNINDSIHFYQQKTAGILIKFSTENPNSMAVVKTLPWLTQLGFSYDSVLVLLNKLPGGPIKNTYSFQTEREREEHVINSRINHKAPDFSRQDVNGKPLRLSDFKDKYVLLDFWASWCVPCRKQTPHIKNMYKQYHSKGLEVIAVACDAKYDAWRKAIKQDSLALFHNVLAFTKSDMEFLKTHDNMMEASFKGELRKLYNLMPIPAQILIDKNGIITGRYSLYDNTTVEDLDKKLSELFGSRF